MGLPDGRETPHKNETNPNPEGLVINGAQVDLTTGVIFSFFVFLKFNSYYTSSCNLIDKLKSCDTPNY